MVQRDYILRMIEQLGAFVAGIVELSRRGKYQEALALVDQGLLRYVGLSARMVDSLSDEELVALLRLQGGGASGAPTRRSWRSWRRCCARRRRSATRGRRARTRTTTSTAT